MSIQRVHRDKGRCVTGFRRCLLLICLLIFSVGPMRVVAVPVVTYPRPESDSDSRASYPVALLAACAAKSKNGFVIKPSEFHAQQGRNIRQLALGNGLDVLWAVTTEEREQQLLPIRIPIDRGLIGWRLLLIRNDEADLFRAVSTREQLAKLRAGQGHDWPDLDVLRANHFTLSSSTTYEGLFHMLSRGHIQYFPRSVSEIWAEADKHREQGIGVEKTLAIHYPEALYFFVNKSNAALASALTSCLNAMTQDGSLQTLLLTFYGDSLQKAQFDRRTIIKLNNPLLPTNTPAPQSNYWFYPMGSPK